ncbi:TPA_asm: UL6.5 sORF 1 [Human alphaherpesvirus 1]|nr:TPA_asm: UL6.5 sORF 1 [Human alphaherpesvirus 1]
MDLLTSIMS